MIFKRNTIKGIQMALVDLVTLSRTKLIYKSYMSSFGAIAAKVYDTPVITAVLANPSRQWRASRQDDLIPSWLEWENLSQQWKMKKLTGAPVWTKLEVFRVLMKCRYFYSKCYQIGFSRFLRAKRGVTNTMMGRQI